MAAVVTFIWRQLQFGKASLVTTISHLLLPAAELQRFQASVDAARFVAYSVRNLLTRRKVVIR